MPQLEPLLRHCPSCGRRFGVQLENKVLSSVERDSYTTVRAGTSSRTRMAAVSGLGKVKSDNQLTWDGYSEPTNKVRVMVTRSKFQYSYECRHCGHKWIEERTIESQPDVKNRRD